MSINRTVLCGRLVKDCELRYTASGVACNSFTLAVDDGYGEKKHTSFINIVAWRQLAELTANHLQKGSQCIVEGKLQQRSYDNKEVKKVYVYEVVIDNCQFLDSKKSEKVEDPFKNEKAVNLDGSDLDLPF